MAAVAFGDPSEEATLMGPMARKDLRDELPLFHFLPFPHLDAQQPPRNLRSDLRIAIRQRRDRAPHLDRVLGQARLHGSALDLARLNRDLFLPFIERLRSTMDIAPLNARRDYRLGRVRARETYLHPATAENRVAFNTLWHDLTDGASGQVDVLEVLGRKRTVPKAAHACASFTFFELCGEALGPPDYLAIAKHYRTVFISGVTKLKAHQRNEAKRFILMVDTFSDAGTRLVILADAAPDALFPKNIHAFESKRTVSRLKEMQSSSWWGVVASDT